MTVLTDIATGERIASYPRVGDHLEMSGDGQRLLLGSLHEDGVQVFDTESGAQASELREVGGEFWCGDLDPTGALAVTWFNGVNRATVWDARTGDALAHLEDFTVRYGGGEALFGPDGERLLVGGPRFRLVRVGREMRDPTEVAARVRERVPWRLEEGRLVPVDSTR